MNVQMNKVPTKLENAFTQLIGGMWMCGLNALLGHTENLLGVGPK